MSQSVQDSRLRGLRSKLGKKRHAVVKVEAAVGTTLNIIDPSMSHKIVQCTQPEILRRFAHACAEFAVRRCQMSDPTLEQALELAVARLQEWPGEEELAPMRRAALAIAERWDDVADEARADFKRRHGDEPDVYHAFGESDAALITYRAAFARSRAATSVF